MQLAHFRHRGLRKLYREGDAKGVPPAIAGKLLKLLFALETADEVDQVSRFPGWKLHPLKGDLRGFWSLTVTANWRSIFRYDEVEHCKRDRLDRLPLGVRNAYEKPTPSGGSDQNRDH